MKKRLDQILVNRGLAESKTKAQALIMAGQVLVDGQISDKVGRPTPDDVKISVNEAFPYVSRGALKLEKAFTELDLDFERKIVCDIGSSTGGFTDFALQHGARKVYAIDVGTGQLAQKIREDKRVVVMEKTDFRDVSSLPEHIDIFVCDVSFISLKKIIPKIGEIISLSLRGGVDDTAISSNDEIATPSARDDDKCADIILLIKPQFEAGVKDVTRGKGVIRDEILRHQIVDDIQIFVKEQGFTLCGLVESPITGAKGNVEYLLYLTS
jgi:23S rRNA (cytidine1920-2'-O)/16S rRNA (cytidine1409-2'-O)-methyltransferase